VRLNDSFLVQPLDWPDSLGSKFDRALMGEGCIDYAALCDGLGEYAGWFEVEVLNEELRTLGLPERFERAALSFEREFAPCLASSLRE
jgi:hypothetical protein